MYFQTICNRNANEHRILQEYEQSSTKNSGIIEKYLAADFRSEKHAVSHILDLDLPLLWDKADIFEGTCRIHDHIRRVDASKSFYQTS